MSVLAPNTNQKEHTMPEQFEQFVKCPAPPYPEAERFHMVPRSTSTIHEREEGYFLVGRVRAAAHSNPEKLIQIASDALLLAEHLRERQSAVQAEKEAENDAQQLEKEAQALYEAAGGQHWKSRTSHHQKIYLTMARKAREIHGVSK